MAFPRVNASPSRRLSLLVRRTVPSPNYWADRFQACCGEIYNGTMEDTRGWDVLFARMIDCGNLLADAQRLEAKRSEIYSRQQTPASMDEWIEARRWLAALAADYTVAIREWREGIEGQCRLSVPHERGWSTITPSYHRE